MYQFLCVVYIYLVNKQFDIYEIHTSGIYIRYIVYHEETLQSIYYGPFICYLVTF